MCGIAGILNLNNQPIQPEIIQKMKNVMRHRGPDDEGQFNSHDVVFGHRRLSIIDLSSRGHQPMSNEDETIWIVFNGEIYNYQSLNVTLESRSHFIKSHCDTETLLHLYEEYGTQCVHHLRGMFSFAIWDDKKKRLFAAVDRLRIKPFYYTRIGDVFVFASELKAIVASGLYKRKINMEAVHHYLSLQAVPVPHTIYEDVYTLPGGFCLELQDGRVSSYQYWDIPFEEKEIQPQEYYIKQLKELLYESVEIRLMSDVPLGAFLSGGIDSSVIVALMKNMKNEPVKTFSIGYDVGGKHFDDTHYANIVSQHFNTDHTTQIVTARDIMKELKNFIWYLDQPSTDAINSYFVSKLASQNVTVALCGQGGDELFAGYRTFDLMLRFLERDRKWEKLPVSVRQALTSAYSAVPGRLKSFSKARSISRFFHWYGSFIRKYGTIRMELSEKNKNELYVPKIREQMNNIDSHDIYQEYFEKMDGHLNPINKVSYMDLKTHLGDILMRDVDAMSMAFSLETRIPLIDHKLVEFVATVPPELKLWNGMKKYLFLETVKNMLPEEIITRPKLGFAFPFNIWLCNQLRPLVEFVLSREVVERRGIFQFNVINKIKQDFYSGTKLNYRRIWGFIILELWLRLVEEDDHSFFDKLNDHVMPGLNKK
jgi:asparagine synthase (glutamine-hydrolysing)